MRQRLQRRPWRHDWHHARAAGHGRGDTSGPVGSVWNHDEGHLLGNCRPRLGDGPSALRTPHRLGVDPRPRGRRGLGIHAANAVRLCRGRLARRRPVRRCLTCRDVSPSVARAAEIPDRYEPPHRDRVPDGRGRVGLVAGPPMSAVAVAPLTCRPEDWECPGPLPPDSFAPIRRRMVLHQCKWDPQVGDVETIARHPIVLPGSLLDGLGAVAERLDAEGEAAAHELAGRPELVRRLGLPGCLARVLSDLSHDWTPAAARVVRFDFHPTTDGWRISEANSDVPGGFAESSHLPRLMAEHLSGTRPWGDPQDAIARAIQAAVNGAGRVALVAAPGYMEDQQVVAGLAAALREIGLQTWRGRPAQVTWTDGHARCLTPQGPLRLDAVVRFFQGEWLPRLSRNSGWQLFIRGGHTPVCNP